MKKFRVVSLLLAMTLFLTACGGEGKTNESAGNSMNRNAVFKEIQDVYALEGDISQIAVVGDILYVEQYQYNQDAPMAKMKTAATSSTASDISSLSSIPSSSWDLTPSGKLPAASAAVCALPKRPPAPSASTPPVRRNGCPGSSASIWACPWATQSRRK